ncbi:cytochrome P450 [Mycena capillaripes]|nr:cytochrome P450 [Mycena capillaripes]
MIFKLVLPVIWTLVCYGLFRVGQFLYQVATSPLRHVAGPRNASFLFGNFKEMEDDASLTARWRSEFGRTFVFKGLFSISELHSSDIKAINHIMTHGSIYRKPPALLGVAKMILGNGILSVEGDDHKRHRRILNQAFGVAQIRLLTEILVEKSVQLRDIWGRRVTQENGEARIDVLEWVRRITLDVIGQAGFNYRFGALTDQGTPSELHQAFTDLTYSPDSQRHGRLRFVSAIVPVLKFLPMPGTRALKAARTQMYPLGLRIVGESKDLIKDSADMTLSGKRDLLSVLLKSNLSPNVPEAHRLSEDEVVAQIPTFLFAGHETLSAAVSWALHALSLNPGVQTKLRDELFTISTENPTMDELNSLPYLENVVRETMRVHTPAPATHKVRRNGGQNV